MRKHSSQSVFAALLVLLLCACQSSHRSSQPIYFTATPPVAAKSFVTPSPVGAPRPSVPSVFHTDKLAEMDAAIEQAIADKKCPGGVLWLERNGVAYRKTYGKRSLVPTDEVMTEDTIFDAASLTKVVATTPSI